MIKSLVVIIFNTVAHYFAFHVMLDLEWSWRVWGAGLIVAAAAIVSWTLFSM